MSLSEPGRAREMTASDSEHKLALGFVQTIRIVARYTL